MFKESVRGVRRAMMVHWVRYLRTAGPILRLFEARTFVESLDGSFDCVLRCKKPTVDGDYYVGETLGISNRVSVYSCSVSNPLCFLKNTVQHESADLASANKDVAYPSTLMTEKEDSSGVRQYDDEFANLSPFAMCG